MRKYLLLVLIFCIFSVTCIFAQESDSNVDTALLKSQLLVQKGEKAESRADFDEAVACYEESYEACKNNILPLLKLANLHTKVGMYDLANKSLKEIPIDKLNSNGKAEVLTLMGKVAIAKENYGEAADCFRKANKAAPNYTAPKIRLSLINLYMGMVSRANELLAKDDDFSAYSPNDLGMCLAVDFYHANFSRAYNTCCLISKARSKSSKSLLSFITNNSLFLFVSYLPLFLSKFIYIFYFAMAFIALGLSASVLSKKTSLWHICTFVFIGVSLMYLAKNYAMNDVYKLLLSGYCSIYDGVWILPKVIIASHLMLIVLFFVFPCFKLVKEEIRPAAYELLGIWLFCFFFGIFVLSFQSQIDNIITRFSYMLVGLFCSFISSMIMPFGRLMLYKLSQATGISSLGKVSGSKLASGSMNFTDAKILEDKIWGHINSGDIDKAVAVGKTSNTQENLSSYPKFWLALMVAQIFNEEYDFVSKSMIDFTQVFQGTAYCESGLVVEALLRTEKGDFPVAYKLVNAISAEGAKNMSADESAISLLVLARCCMNINDNVQAHINYNKAFSCVKSQFLKFVILTDLAEIDCKMNAQQAMQKWKNLLISMSGNGKSLSYKNTINSMIAYSENRKEDALKLAEECLKDKIITGKSLAWYGHLLCENNKLSEAEALISKMTAGSYCAECLMTEVTSL